MNGIAALAAKEVVAASGLGAGLLPGVAPSAVDGFAAGTLLSGVCFLLIVAPRHGLRWSRLSARGRSLPDPAEAIEVTDTTACTPADGPGYAPPAADDFAPAPAPGYAPAPELGYAPAPGFAPAPAAGYATGTGASYAAALPAHAGYPAASAMTSPLADEAAETIVAASSAPTGQAPAEPKVRGYQSKHRLTDTEAERRTDTRRAPGRHAAPVLRKSSRTPRISFHPLAVRD